jgi:hypothetical protein
MSGGKALVRQALKARNRSPAFIANLKAEIPGLGTGAIEAWINGDDRAVTRGQLDAMIASIWGASIALDFEADVLRSANTKPATPLAAAHPTTAAVNAPVAILDRVVGQTYPPPLAPPSGPPRPSLLKKIGWS